MVNQQIVICFHRTTTENAKNILLVGFQDNAQIISRELAGIWLSKGAPYDANEGAKGNAILAVEMPVKVFRKYDAGDNGGTPAACIPAMIINQYRVYVYDHDSSGIGREVLLSHIASFRENDYKEKADYWENIVLPFLERYDLLDKEGPL